MITPVKRNLDPLAMIGAAFVVTFGWKNSWVINVFNLLFMSVITAIRLIYPHSTEVSETIPLAPQSTGFKRD
jgi:hypothetical protein